VRSPSDQVGLPQATLGVASSCTEAVDMGSLKVTTTRASVTFSAPLLGRVATTVGGVVSVAVVRTRLDSAHPAASNTHTTKDHVRTIRPSFDGYGTLTESVPPTTS
jgi:hypothetical protein